MTPLADPIGLTLEVNDAGPRALRVVVAGELDLANCQRVPSELEGRINGALDLVRLDLSGLTFMDSTGLRTLWTLRQDVSARGGKLVIESPSPAVVRVLEVTGMNKVFDLDGTGNASA